MGRSALGKTYQQVEEGQSSFNFPQLARTFDPPSSHEAAEDMTASGKRDKHRQIILTAMIALNATKEKPCTGLQIANEAGLHNVEVMRRLRVNLAYPGLIESTSNENRVKCPVDGKLKLGWWLVK